MKEERVVHGLLIEDDPEDTMLLMHLLSRNDWPSMGFSFVWAESLTAGLKMLSECSIDVVLLDLMLPDSNGLDSIAKIRAKNPDVPIIVLTGLQDETLGLNALEHGAQDYQVKGSLESRNLKRAISYAVKRHRTLHALHTVVSNAPDGMVIIDSSGDVRYANPAAEALLMRPAVELVGKPFPYELPNGRVGELELAGDNSSSVILEVRLADIEWSDEPARLASIRNITEMRRAAELKAEISERKHMDQLKDELLGAVSHEMRNPLSIIKAATSNLSDGICGALTSSESEMVQISMRNISKLEKIVSRILDLSRLESGHAQVNIAPFDAKTAIESIVNEFRLIAGNTKKKVLATIPLDLPQVEADSELFSHILANLLDNGLRYAKTKVSVHAAALRDGDVEFTIVDDGGGIPAEQIPELFNKFVQVGRRQHGSDYKGTGLGLAICKEMIALQNGKIWAENAPGGGAAFHFVLRKVGAAARQEEVSHAKAVS